VIWRFNYKCTFHPVSQEPDTRQNGLMLRSVCFGDVNVVALVQGRDSFHFKMFISRPGKAQMYGHVNVVLTSWPPIGPRVDEPRLMTRSLKIAL